MSVTLFGASPLGTRALVRLGVAYDLVVRPGEAVTGLVGAPRSVTCLPFEAEPESALALTCRDDAQAVVSFTEPGLMPAALAAHAHELRGTSVMAVARTHNKLAMRARLHGHVRQPRFGQVGVDAVPPDLAVVVVKPMSGTAGLGVQLLPADEVRSLPAEPPLLWEEYLDGPELSVETVSRVVGGRLHVEVLGLTDKTTSGAPHFVELGHSAPACVSDALRGRIEAVVRRALERLDVCLGAAHSELVVVNGEPVLVETQTRPGGGRVPTLHELVSGVDHYEATLRALLDLPQSAGRGAHDAAAARMLLAAPPTRGPAAASLGACLKADAHIVDVELWEPAGGTGGSDIRSNLDRRGVVVAAGGSRSDVDAALDRAFRRLLDPPQTYPTHDRHVHQHTELPS